MIEAIWAERARLDLLRHVEWIDNHDPDAAARIQRLIVDRANWLIQVPFAGAIVGRSRARSFRVRGTNYTIVYRPERGTVLILRVRHSAENWR